jgi:hypothetical protein
LVQPAVTDDGKVPGLKFGQPRVMSLLLALTMFHHLPPQPDRTSKMATGARVKFSFGHRPFLTSQPAVCRMHASVHPRCRRNSPG